MIANSTGMLPGKIEQNDLNIGICTRIKTAGRLNKRPANQQHLGPATASTASYRDHIHEAELCFAHARLGAVKEGADGQAAGRLNIPLFEELQIGALVAVQTHSRAALNHRFRKYEATHLFL